MGALGSRPPKNVEPGELFAALVRYGHDARSLKDYTPRQLGLYYSWGMRTESRATADVMEAVRMAVWAGKSKFGAQVKTMREV